MSVHVAIGVNDKEIADRIQRELTSRNIKVNRLNADQAMRFGMKLGPVETSPQEFIEIVQATPDIVDALFDTVERFIDRISFFIDRKPAKISNRQALKTSFVPPKTFETLFKRK